MARTTIALFVLALCSLCITANADIADTDCGLFGVFNPCARTWQRTCQDTVHATGLRPPGCVARCQCMQGYVLNREGKCIDPKDCILINPFNHNN